MAGWREDPPGWHWRGCLVDASAWHVPSSAGQLAPTSPLDVTRDSAGKGTHPLEGTAPTSRDQSKARAPLHLCVPTPSKARRRDDGRHDGPTRRRHCSPGPAGDRCSWWVVAAPRLRSVGGGVGRWGAAPSLFARLLLFDWAPPRTQARCSPAAPRGPIAPLSR